MKRLGLVSDLFIIAGLLAIITGVAFVYWPAAIMLGGFGFIGMGIVVGLREPAKPGDKV